MLREIVEMIGPMGGDQRSVRGSTSKILLSDKFDGEKITFTIEGEDEVTDYLESRAKHSGVEIRHKYYSDFEIKGTEKNIKRFLKSIGVSSREIKKYF